MLIPSGTSHPRPTGKWALRKEFISGIVRRGGKWEPNTEYWWVLRNNHHIYACGPDWAFVAKYIELTK